MTYVLEIEQLKKSYDDKQILKGVDLQVKEGDFFALLWHNGAGKTTTIGILTSLVNKDSGKVLIAGQDIDKDFSQAKTYIGVVPQEFNMDVFARSEDICLFAAGYYGVSRKEAKVRAKYFMEKLDLWDKKDAQVKQLSWGMKRRLMIARALMHKPKILILDEPTAGVDVELRKTMWEFIQELNDSGTTIILTTHYLEEVEQMCRNVAILTSGKIVHQGSVKKLLSTLSHEVFVFDIKNPIESLPWELEYYAPKLTDTQSFELTIAASEGMNKIFSILSSHNIEVLSMRNKSNRLEQLFLYLAKK